jgi:hypothetical protein
VSGQWARPFRVTYPGGTFHHGVQFPNGHCFIALISGYHAAISFEDLGIPADAVVEWADGGDA